MRSCTLAALVLALVTLAGCGGSSSSTADAAFASRGRVACREYVAAVSGYLRAHLTSTAAAQTVTHRISVATDASLAKLRALVPPSSTGVDAGEWRRAIDALRDDLHLADRFYAREYPRLLRAYYTFHPVRTTDQPPSLSEAYDTQAGRRFLRLERRLTERRQAHERAWREVARRAGLLRACSAR